MKLDKILLIYSILLTTCGCGHSVLVEHEVTGFSLRVPVAEGADLGLSIGAVKSTTAAIRGGASIETVSSASGGLLSGDGGINKITTFKANMQLNEGNLKDVMISPDCPDAAKVALASNLCDSVKAPKFAPQILQTERSTIHTGAEAIQSNGVEQITRQTSGIDRLGDNAREIITTTVKETTDVVEHTEDAIQLTAKDWIDAIVDLLSPLSNIKWIVIIIVICICIVLIVFVRNVFCIFKRQNTKKVINQSVPLTSESEKNEQSVSEEDIPDRTKEISTPAEKFGIWARIVAVFEIFVALFSRISPERKKQIFNSICQWVKTHKMEKLEAKKNKKK